MLFALLIIGSTLSATQADTLSLSHVYEKAYDYYPLVEKIEAQNHIERLQRQVAQSRYYPSIELSGLASYQSDVTEVEFVPPGSEVPTFSKDRYTISMDLNQPIYSGGAISLTDQLEQAESEVVRRSVEAAMQQVRQQVDDIYFNILLVKQESKALQLVSEELRERLREVQANVENGAMLPGQQKILEAELIENKQDSIRTQAALRSGFLALEVLTGEDLPEDTDLELPQIAPQNVSDSSAGHPKYRLFSARQSLLDTQRELREAEGRPKLSAFGTAAYGRPGLNMFDDALQPYYIVGVRLRWNFWDWFNSGREIETIRYEQQKLQSDEDAFTRQLNSKSRRIQEEINALKTLLKHDQQIIFLRREVVQESRSQLDNGAITATEFISELQRANRAELARYLHEIQLVQKNIEYLTHTGQSWN